MNQKKAKQIRKSVYGEASRSSSGTKYSLLKHLKKIIRPDKNGVPTTYNKVTGQLKCTGLRAAYKKAKQNYMATGRM